MKRPLVTLTLVATALATAATAPPAAAVVAPAPTYVIRPGALERGANIKIAHLEGRTIVDGSIRVPLRGAHVSLIATSGANYLVGTTNADFEAPKIWRVRPSGARTLILSGYSAFDAEVSDAGARLAVSRIVGKRSTVVEIDTASGAVLGRRTFRGFPTVLDVGGPRVVLGTWSKPRSFIWNTATGRTRTLLDRAGTFADLSSDQLAYFTKDPYRDGCQVLTRLSRPANRIWRSCTERVHTMNVDGSRMATIDILSDGIGPNRVVLRRHTGARLATYDTQGFFGEVQFEDRTHLLLDTTGKKYAATVRCTPAGCERASRLRKAAFPR